MILLDIIVGYYLPSLFGWFFLCFVLLTESLVLAKYLKKAWFDRKVYLSVYLSNAITTIIGFILLDKENHGGHLLSWIPVDHYQGDIRIDRTIFLFIISFIGTVIVETLFNIMLLRKHDSKRKISFGTLLVNAITYTIGAIVILIYTVYNN